MERMVVLISFVFIIGKLLLFDVEFVQSCTSGNDGYIYPIPSTCCPLFSATGKTTAEPPAVESLCGQSQYYHYAGIINGQTALPNEFVRLLITPFTGLPSYNYTCGSSIISDQWLLTAAHCFDQISSPTKIKAYLADYAINETDPGELEMTISEMILHPSYNVIAYHDMDYALLKLSSAINFTAAAWRIQPICLPTTCSSGCDVGSFVKIAGFGSLQEGFVQPSTYLQKALVKIFDYTTCYDQYQNVGGRINITTNMMCAGYLYGGVDSCQGDSGGPLMTNEDGYYKLCGLTSFGEGCARPHYLGVYSKVCVAVDWIKEQTGITF